ncbi:hypothetical protein NITHO_7020003 [Nitrolancea hollandica Lb]|uniref:Uncharacterized protein n=1 Tax=Nitrolancea hollandica Lb TaxID=1129897 RepID=I4EN10_9BACT|nr:hypothetical protein NITHO_7020003 [Nitrolancea hollandica Lb]
MKTSHNGRTVITMGESACGMWTRARPIVVDRLGPPPQLSQLAPRSGVRRWRRRPR